MKWKDSNCPSKELLQIIRKLIDVDKKQHKIIQIWHSKISHSQATRSIIESALGEKTSNQ